MIEKVNKFFKYLQGKRIILVGNGNTIISSKDNGALIDSHDVVIKFNYGMSKVIVRQADKYYGNKCNVWVYAMKNENRCLSCYHSFKTKPEFMIRMCLQLQNDALKNNSIFITKEYKQKVHNEIGISSNKNVSTGITFMHFLINNGIEGFNVIGFDGFKTKNFYSNENINRKWHEGEKEIKYLNRIVKEKRVRIIK